MVDLNRMTHKVQEALQSAGGIVTRRSHQGIDVEHLLQALLEQPDGLAPNLLEAAGVAPRAVEEAVERELARRPQVSGPAAGPSQTFITQRLSQLLTKAEDEMRALKDEYLSVEHLLLAMAAEGGVFRGLGLTRERLMAALQQVRGNQRVTSPDPETTYQALEEEQRLVPQRVGHLAQAHRHAGLGLPQTRGATAAAHLEREMGGHRVALAHAELVIGAGRAPLGLDVVRDAGQPEAALAPPERGALAVADKDHGPGLRFHHLLHPVTSAARRVGGL